MCVCVCVLMAIMRVCMFLVHVRLVQVSDLLLCVRKEMSCSERTVFVKESVDISKLFEAFR